VGLVSLLFSFNGRINRAQYWAGTLGVSAVNFVVLMFVGVTSGLNAAAKADPVAALGASLGALGFIAIINSLTAWCGLALQVKRFHDRGRTGWLTAVPMVLVAWMIMAIFGSAFSGASAAQAWSAVQTPLMLFFLVSLAFFIDLGCLPGKPERNIFGDPSGSPRRPSSEPPNLSGQGASAAANSLFGAQAAIERAIAERPRAAPARATASPLSTPAPTGGGGSSFGRRVTR
jgi:uncharacterized membrane protein YhaH (DUF805 family)